MTDELREQIANFDACVLNRDDRLAESVLDDSYALVVLTPRPSVTPRASWLAMLPDYIVHSYVVDNAEITVDDDVAVLMQRVQMQATVLGQDRSGTFVLTDVWRQRPQGWRLWRRHSAPLTAGPMPESTRGSGG